MRIVHLSATPLAGSPYRLMQAQHRYSPHEVRLIDLTRWGLYPQDVVFDETPDCALDLAERADVIHLHGPLDGESTTFAPIDFRVLAKRGVAFLRHYHSDPWIIAHQMNVPVEAVVNCPLPSVVHAQAPERFFPNARIISNGVPLDDPEYLPSAVPPGVDIAFCPTRLRSAWVKRWNTKGAPETEQIVKSLIDEKSCTFEMIHGKTLRDSLHAKKQAAIVLDDMVTGTYHTSGLEGVSMAKPTVVFLDERTQEVMRVMSGSSTHPFVNCHLENLKPVLAYLLDHPDEAAEIGREGRQWLERFWNQEIVAAQFDAIYHDLLQDPSLICRQPELRFDTPRKQFLAITLPNLIYDSRVIRWQSGTAMAANETSATKRTLKRLSALIRRFMPTSARPSENDVPPSSNHPVRKAVRTS